MAEDDSAWKRPGHPAERAAYPGPPVSQPAEPGWHPPEQPAVAAPRALPAVDHDAIDAAESNAAKFTITVGLVAIAALVLLACTRVV